MSIAEVGKKKGFSSHDVFLFEPRNQPHLAAGATDSHNHYDRCNHGTFQKVYKLIACRYQNTHYLPSMTSVSMAHEPRSMPSPLGLLFSESDDGLDELIVSLTLISTGSNHTDVDFSQYAVLLQSLTLVMEWFFRNVTWSSNSEENSHISNSNPPTSLFFTVRILFLDTLLFLPAAILQLPHLLAVGQFRPLYRPSFSVLLNSAGKFPNSHLHYGETDGPSSYNAAG